PRRRTLVAVERDHALGRAAASTDDEEIETLAAIGGEGDAFTVGRPCRLALGFRSLGQLGRIASVGLGAPDGVEHDNGEALAVGRPRRVAEAGSSVLGAGRNTERACNREREQEWSYSEPFEVRRSMFRFRVPVLGSRFNVLVRGLRGRSARTAHANRERGTTNRNAEQERRTSNIE